MSLPSSDIMICKHNMYRNTTVLFLQNSWGGGGREFIHSGNLATIIKILRKYGNVELTEKEAELLERLITLERASIVLKNMENGKSPGTDGS